MNFIFEWRKKYFTSERSERENKIHIFNVFGKTPLSI